MNPLLHIAIFGLLLSFLPNGTLLAASLEERVEFILSLMTVEEKIEQLHSQDLMTTRDNLRLGIPGFVMADGPHGVRDGLATCFPVGVAMAATWDTDLVTRIGLAMGREFRAKGKNQALGPCVDVLRDPRSGRNAESAGEDPFLCARIGEALTRGIQETACIATVKHFDVNTKQENRTTNDHLIDDRTLIEFYSVPFRRAVQDGQAWTVMNAYNLINGEKCAENHHLLTDILRSNWGFAFHVVSDWGAVWDAERSIEAGTDVEMGSDTYAQFLHDLVVSGVVSQATLDDAVRRVLRAKIRAGLLDGQPTSDLHLVDCAAHRALAREAAQKCLVLLKNQDDILPLSPGTLSSLAVIGPSAAVAQLDGYGSSYVFPTYAVSPLEGILAFLNGSVPVTYAKGCEINDSDTSGFGDALAAAQAAEAVIFIGGLDTTMEGETRDRVTQSIDLPGVQGALIDAIAAVNSNLVVVLEGGGAIGIHTHLPSIKGLIYGFYPGQEGGNAIAEVLFGAVNPQGKMPYTIPASDAQLPPWNEDHRQDLIEGRGIRWFDLQGYTPDFPFGFGLSYTTFAYGTPTITALQGHRFLIEVEVENSGNREGAEIVQLYLAAVDPSLPMPVKQLRDFSRIILAAGAAQTVAFELSAEDFWVYDEGAGCFSALTGSFSVGVGGSSTDLEWVPIEVVPDTPRPDLTLCDVSWIPPFPEPEGEVNFLATIKNVGTGASPSSTVHRVAFAVNGESVALAEGLVGPLKPGQSVTLSVMGPRAGGAWFPPRSGTYSVSATFDPQEAITELREDNNALNAELIVSPRNLARKAPTTASSIEHAGTPEFLAVDGCTSTRWSSSPSDPQWLSIDLGFTHTLDRVVLNWEDAFATEFKIQASPDDVVWTDLSHETNGTGGLVELACTGTGRYVRMLGIQRGTPFGYSLREFAVFGVHAPELQSPYGDSIHLLPGDIEAEDYDLGGAQIAYRDADAGNQGGSYRGEDVDIDFSETASNHHFVGWTVAGEWLEFTVRIAIPGTYRMQAKVATPSPQAAFRLCLDGEDISGTIAVPPTGGWTTWIEVMTSDLSLPMGLHTLKLFLLGDPVNFDRIRLLHAAWSEVIDTWRRPDESACGVAGPDILFFVAFANRGFSCLDESKMEKPGDPARKPERSSETKQAAQNDPQAPPVNAQFEDSPISNR